MPPLCRPPQVSLASGRQSWESEAKAGSLRTELVGSRNELKQAEFHSGKGPHRRLLEPSVVGPHDKNPLQGLDAVEGGHL